MIVQRVEEFYGKLWKKHVFKESIIEALSFIKKKKKTIRDQGFGTGLDTLTWIKVLEVLKKKKKGKSPGSDGLPLEFYLTLF